MSANLSGAGKYGKCDVLVVGGGPSGVAAAIAAARPGVEVILVESQSFLGGLGTGGSVLWWPGFNESGSRVFGGVTLEILAAADELGGVYYNKPPFACRGGYVIFDSELLRFVLQETVLDAGVRLIQHMTAIDVIMSGDLIESVVFHSKAGRSEISAKVFVDATGDGDLIAYSGAPFRRAQMPASSAWCIGGISFDNRELEKYAPYAEPDDSSGFYADWRKFCKDIGVQVCSPLPTPNHSSIWTDGTLLYGLDSLDPVDLTKIDVEGRRTAVKLLLDLREKKSGYKDAFIYQFSTLTAIRAARLLDGEYVLTDADVQDHSCFKDCVGIAWQDTGDHDYFEVPFRSLFTKKVPNLLVSGRCVSVQSPPENKFIGAFQVIRNIPHCMVTGQAAGVSAVVAVRDNKMPFEIDVLSLQGELKKQKVKFEPDGTTS